jgi:hypothetical protein
MRRHHRLLKQFTVNSASNKSPILLSQLRTSKNQFDCRKRSHQSKSSMFQSSQMKSRHSRLKASAETKMCLKIIRAKTLLSRSRYRLSLIYRERVASYPIFKLRTLLSSSQDAALLWGTKVGLRRKHKHFPVASMWIPQISRHQHGDKPHCYSFISQNNKKIPSRATDS